jgi:hypothetical protein
MTHFFMMAVLLALGVPCNITLLDTHFMAINHEHKLRGHIT